MRKKWEWKNEKWEWKNEKWEWKNEKYQWMNEWEYKKNEWEWMRMKEWEISMRMKEWEWKNEKYQWEWKNENEKMRMKKWEWKNEKWERNVDSLEWERNERHGHDEQVEQVEHGPAEGALVQHEAVRDGLQTNLHRKDGCEKYIEVIEDLERKKNISKNISKKIYRSNWGSGRERQFTYKITSINTPNKKLFLLLLFEK